MPENESGTTPDTGAKPKSIFSDLSFRTLHLLGEKPISLFRTWYLVVYHPRAFFEYFFGPQSDFRVRSTIFLGVSRLEIDTTRHKILSPFWFITGTASISIPLLAIATHVAPSPGSNGEEVQNMLPEITNIQILDEFILASVIMILILAYSLLWAGYVFLVCKKEVFL